MTATANHIRTAAANQIRTAAANHIRRAGVNQIRINAEQRSTDRCDRSVQDSPRQGNRTAVKQNEILYRYLFFIIIPDPHYGRPP